MACPRSSSICFFNHLNLERLNCLIGTREVTHLGFNVEELGLPP